MRGDRVLRLTDGALVAFAVVPELLQHIAEIKLGMFASMEAARAHANDPLRWAFGVPKLIGYVLAILLVARFWKTGSTRRALLIPPRQLLLTAALVAALVAISWPTEWIGRQGLPTAVTLTAQLLFGVIQMVLLVHIIGAVIGLLLADLRHSPSHHLPTALVLLLLLAACHFPVQAVHMANHKLAIGGPIGIVWAAMAFDALWVGFMAALMGSALFVACRTVIGWRGWSVSPAALDRARSAGS